MAIHEPKPSSPPTYYPEGDYSIVKYLDLTKFLSLLSRKELFFCRIDKLEDQFEGRLPKPNYDLRVQFQKELRDSGFFKVEMPDDKIYESVNKSYTFNEKIRSLTCVNCWNKKSEESAALWKIYSDFNKGIMIKSSIGGLLKAFEGAPQELFLSEIRYLDYQNQAMPDGNSFYPIIHKNKAYSYEDELRLIYSITPPEGWDHDWTNEEVPEGVYIPVNLNTLIEEIILSPYSPSWFHKLIQDILSRYNINKPLRKSTLSNPG